MSAAETAQKKEPVEQASSGRRVREGVVLSNKMNKTLIVGVTRIEEHPQFKKIIKKRVKYAVHDEKNEAKIGDKVRIIETRPLSKTKCWRLVKVLAS
jgi:small subunit ribosomal protein S17